MNSRKSVAFPPPCHSPSPRLHAWPACQIHDLLALLFWLPPRPNELLMSVRSSFSAAVVAALAMVGFSAAFQPAAASPIVIDDFTQTLSATSSGGSTIGNVNNQGSDTGSFGPFEVQEIYSSWSSGATRPSRSVGAISTGSSGQLYLSQTTTASGTTAANGARSYFGYAPSVGTVNLTTSGTFLITTLATSSTGAFRGYMEISTLGGGAVVDLGSMWAPNTTTSIPFSAFTAVNPNVDFTQVDIMCPSESETPLNLPLPRSTVRLPTSRRFPSSRSPHRWCRSPASGWRTAASGCGSCGGTAARPKRLGPDPRSKPLTPAPSIDAWPSEYGPGTNAPVTKTT